MISRDSSRRRQTTALTLLALCLAVLPSVVQAHPPDAPGAVETLVSFDASRLETPESLVFDRAGNLYISLALTGEIRRIAPNGAQSTFAVIPIGAPLTPCHGFLAILGAANAAFPFFSDTHQPSLMRLHLGVPGAPLGQ